MEPQLKIIPSDSTQYEFTEERSRNRSEFITRTPPKFDEREELLIKFEREGNSLRGILDKLSRNI